MKKIILFVLIFTCHFLFSQKELSKDYSYKVSAPYKVFDAKQKIYFSQNNQSITIKFDEKKVLIQKFDNEKPSFKKEKLYEKFFPKNYRVEDVLELNSKYYVLYSSWNGDDDKEQLFSVEIDFEKGEFLTPKLIISIDGKITGKKSFSFFGGGIYDMMDGTQDKFDFLVSHDKKKMLVQYRKKPEVKNDKKSYDIIGLVAFDDDMTQISEKELKMPYTERKMDNLDYQLDNEGNLYLLAKVFHDDSNDDKKRSKDETANYHIELFFIKSGTNEIKISKFENKNKFITKLWLFDSPQNFLVCGGFFNNGKDNSGFFSRESELDDSDGVLAFKIDKQGNIYDAVSHEIPAEIINQYESAKTKKKNDKKEKKGNVPKIANLVLDHIIVNQDGSLVLIGEQYFVVTHTSMGANGSMSTRTTYSYLDILATKIGVSGELMWMKKIPKSQYGTRGQGGMSYKYFSANNQHYLIFLDNVKNIDLPIDKTPAQHTDGQGGYLTAVKIADSDGTISKSSILNGRDIEDFKMHQFSVDRVFKTSENTFMLEVYKKKKEDVMIKVEMK